MSYTKTRIGPGIVSFPGIPAGEYTVTVEALGYNTEMFPATVIADQVITYSVTMTLVPPPEYNLTISTTVGGTTDPAPGAHTYLEGTVVTVSAYPSTGYVFDHWELDGVNVGSMNPISVTMDNHHTLRAVFTALPPEEYTLTIGTTIGGTTDPAPGSYIHLEGTIVQVMAIPDVGYYFDHWILDGLEYTANPISILMDGDHSLTAYFAESPPPPPPTYKLTINSTDGGTTDPIPGIYEYDADVTIEVTAHPGTGYEFDHWDLDGVSRYENPIYVVMDTDHTLLAVFAELPPPPPPSHILTVISNPIEGIFFTADTKGGVTPASLSLTEGTYIVTMPSSVVSGEEVYNFKNWEDGSTNPERSVELVADVTITATYEKPPPPPTPEKGVLDIHAFFGENEVPAQGRIIETRESFTTPARIELDPGVYRVFCRYRLRPQVKYGRVEAGQTTRLDFQFRLAQGLVRKFPTISKIFRFPFLNRLGHKMRR